MDVSDVHVRLSIVFPFAKIVFSFDKATLLLIFMWILFFLRLFTEDFRLSLEVRRSLPTVQEKGKF